MSRSYSSSFWLIILIVLLFGGVIILALAQLSIYSLFTTIPCIYLYGIIFRKLPVIRTWQSNTILTSNSAIAWSSLFLLLYLGIGTWLLIEYKPEIPTHAAVQNILIGLAYGYIIYKVTIKFIESSSTNK